LRQAYDYWQDQPGSCFLVHGARPHSKRSNRRPTSPTQSPTSPTLRERKPPAGTGWGARERKRGRGRAREEEREVVVSSSTARDLGQTQRDRSVRIDPSPSSPKCSASLPGKKRTTPGSQTPGRHRLGLFPLLLCSNIVEKMQNIVESGGLASIVTLLSRGLEAKYAAANNPSRPLIGHKTPSDLLKWRELSLSTWHLDLSNPRPAPAGGPTAPPAPPPGSCFLVQG
jgi:hypothetical protein